MRQREQSVQGLSRQGGAGRGPAARDRLGHESLPLVHQLVGHALYGHPEVDAVTRETVRHVLAGLDGLRRPADFRSYLVTTTIARIRAHADHVYDPALPAPTSTSWI